MELKNKTDLGIAKTGQLLFRKLCNINVIYM